MYKKTADNIKKILKKNKNIYLAANIIRNIFNGKYFKFILSCISVYVKGKELISDMNDGLLRIRITNKCNAKCRYCGIQFWTEENRNKTMDSKILYEYCKPLYENIKIILLTGGDPLIAKESFNYCKFISDNYPQITVMLESNGIAFDNKWQNLAMNNLIRTHFSINASDEYVYEKGCWPSDEGKNAYVKAEENIKTYIKLLKDNGLEMFAPSFSMVVNKDTAPDVRAFIKKSLSLGAQYSMFYFDYTENDMSSDYFGCPEISRSVLEELMKIERVLAKKFFVYFRLWIPLKESEIIQKKVESLPIEKLQSEYSDLIELAKDRSMEEEYKKRREIRKIKGKKEFTFEEDWTPTIRQTEKNNKKVCFAPFKELDIYPNGDVECCGWMTPRMKIDSFVKNNSIDWNKFFNSFKMKIIRNDMLNDNFNLCMKCCPLNPVYHSVCSPHQYGYDRIQK